nr:odorant receptor Or1-like [Onthophagus taurus]
MILEWDRLKLRNSLYLNIILLKLGGCWWPETENRTTQKLYTCYSVLFLLSTLVLYSISEIIYIFHVLDDLEELTSCLFLFFTHAVQMIKIRVFLIQQKDIKKFLNEMDDELFMPRYHEQQELMKTSIKRYKIVYAIFQFTGIATCVLWAVLPFLERKQGENISLPLRGWYPFDVDRYPTLQIILCFQIILVTISAILNINIDATVASFMRFFCNQFDLLNDSLEHIKRRCENDNDHDKNLQTKMDLELERIVRHHLLILSMIQKFFNLFSVVVFVQVGITVLTMCMSMFKSTSVQIGGIQFMSMIMYQLCILIQAFLYCWYGNEIMLKSGLIPLSAFKSDWTDCSQQFKKNLLFVMMRTRVPVKLYAAGLVTLSVENFTSILRTSYSCFAVLHRVQENN